MRCVGRVPSAITETGVSGLRPYRNSSSATAPIRSTAISSTSVPELPPSSSQFTVDRSSPGATWTDTTWNSCATPRWVTGTQALAGHAHRAGDAGHDGDRDPGAQAGQDLLGPPAEHERIAALEPGHEPAGLGVADQRRVDVLLGHGPAVRDLARVDDLHVVAQLVEQRAGRQPVGEHHVGLGEQLPPAHGDQPGVAGPAADDRDPGGVTAAVPGTELAGLQAGHDRVADRGAVPRVAASGRH